MNNLLLDKGPRYACSKVRCDKRQEKKDKRNYRIEYIVDPEVCCASYKRTACKAGSKEYEVNWKGNFQVATKIEISLDWRNLDLR